MTSANSRTGGRVWAIAGGLVVTIGIVAIIISAITSQGPSANEPSPSGTTGPTASEPTSSPSTGDDVVQPIATVNGWIPEPVTTDAETYIRAALEAASTFDTTRSSRDEWLAHLDAWFTPDTRYAEADRTSRMESAQLELRQGVVLPVEDWDSLANENGRVVATTIGQMLFVPVAEDPSGDMSIGTADVELTFTRSDDDAGEASYDESVRVSVQVLCGAGTIPTPNSAQRAGDCKVVRYFTEPMEP